MAGIIPCIVARLLFLPLPGYAPPRSHDDDLMNTTPWDQDVTTDPSVDLTTAAYMFGNRDDFGDGEYS